MYSAIVDGEVLDYHYKKHFHYKDWYCFYIGDVYVGNIIPKTRRRSWSALANGVCYNSGEPKGFCLVDGFATRFDAAEYLLRVQGYRT